MSLAKIVLFFIPSILLTIGFNVQKATAQVQWLPASNGEFPTGAVTGGEEKGRQIYICKAQYKTGYYPGKIIGKYCNISWQGREITVPNYQVLVSLNNSGWHPIWQNASNGEIPDGAVAGGIEKGRQIYICKVKYKDGFHPGKLDGNSCYITWGGREFKIPDYQVLTFQDKPQSNALQPSNTINGSASDLLRQSQEKLQRQDYRGAMSDINQAMLLDPNDANIYFNRGLILYALGDELGAIEDFDATLLRNPYHALAYLHRAGLRIIRNDQPGAMQDLQLAAKLFLDQGDKTRYQRVQKLMQRIQQ